MRSQIQLILSRTVMSCFNILQKALLHIIIP